VTHANDERSWITLDESEEPQDLRPSRAAEADDFRTAGTLVIPKLLSELPDGHSVAS